MKQCESSTNSNPHGVFGKMFPDYFLPMEEETLRGSSFAWRTLIISAPSGFSTHNGTEWHSVEEGCSACSLASILEPSVPARYFLSSRACAGILRRAEKRGKDLPTALRHALQQVAEGQSEQGKREGKTA